jgi:hypothetical protein
MATGTLEILARIPSLSSGCMQGGPQPRAIVSPEAAAGPEAAIATRRQPRQAVRLPVGSIALLALIAAAVWVAAAWHDRVRFLRQQPPARWAEAFDGDAASPGGVVR